MIKLVIYLVDNSQTNHKCTFSLIIINELYWIQIQLPGECLGQRVIYRSM